MVHWKISSVVAVSAIILCMTGLRSYNFANAFQQQRHVVNKSSYHHHIHTAKTVLHASSERNKSRRDVFRSIPSTVVSSLSLLSLTTLGNPKFASADENAAAVIEAVEVIPKGDVRKLFNEARAMENQGNMPAAQRLYVKITKIAPRVSEKMKPL